jgi:hypothetical protein
VRSLAELEAAARIPCVVKDPYGVAGQGNVVVDSPAGLALLQRGLRRHGDAPVELVVQPLFERRWDFAAHLSITPAGDPERLGVRMLVNDGHSFRGSAGAPPELLAELEARTYWPIVESVAAAVAAQGYFGPLSVDSMLTTDGTLVPVLEVNARMSPGYVAARIGAPVRMQAVRVDRPDFFERLVDALADERRLAVGGRPGVLPLAASTLLPPRGWLFHATFGGADPDVGAVLARLAGASDSEGSRS